MLMIFCLSLGERAMQHPLPSFLLSALLICMATVAEAASQIAAANRLHAPIAGTFAVPIDSNSSVRIAQTFTTEIGGQLLSASVTAVSLDADPTGLQLAVSPVDNGQPGAILASAPLQGLYTNGRFTALDVPNAVADFGGTQIILTAHQQYALLFVASRPQSSYQVLGDQTIGTQRQYAGGQLLRSIGGMPYSTLPTGDLVFEVIVDAIPEPMSLTLVALAAACCWPRRLSRHRS